MQDINLLQNKLKDKTNQWERGNRFATVMLVIILLAEVAATGFFFMMKARAEDEKMKLDQENVALQSKLTNLESDLGDAKNFQAQSKNIATLLDTHVSWSEIVSELLTSTYKSSQYFSFNTDTTGKIHMEGMAADYANVGKMLLALETSDEFTQVQLLSLTAATGEAPGVMFSVDVYADPEIFIRNN